ncbi:hypothetical protein MA04_03207 [Alcanivorax balearicus MACL04]|uniref:N-acetyltransferase domain-containing protein n=1 Tax=Alloalcanivorax balearicus MACL04 TaxID=1177182 RepID=A0ABT2R291_9GAMM|nr:hypothetical protein [Alloalcanivorax balearicus]MCU5783907.1 hypothetical protein [Alloalcanivorax balearicus MACL04]
MAGDTGNTLKTRYVPIERISFIDMKEMYGLYEKYYQNVSLEVFVKDMSEKSGVFMVRRTLDQQVVGFSTLKTVPMNVRGRAATGVFSGDTILEKQYWGDRSLQTAFLRWMVREKMKRPTRMLVWLLISKGYKTYLLLANNFNRYYPHPDGHHQDLADYVDHYCERLYSGSYCSERKLLDFGENYSALKGAVAPISQEMRDGNVKIRFFEERNPTWERGTELPCVGVFDRGTAQAYLAKLWRKRPRRLRLALRPAAYE